MGLLPFVSAPSSGVSLPEVATSVEALTAVERAGGHKPSHRSLMDAVADAGPVKRTGLVDLIVVPTSRSFLVTEPGIEIAVRLAHGLDARLLVICSGDAEPDQFPAQLLRSWPARVALMTMPSTGTESFLPDFDTSGHPFASSEWIARRDVADKRNLALLVAAGIRWRHVLFLDDDVRLPLEDAEAPPQAFGDASVANAFAQMDAGLHHLVGWTMTEFPDNSAVCHARRWVELPQSSFIGGGSLAVRVTRKMPFFPRVYNEDWLFTYPYLVRKRRRAVVGSAGVIHQAEYDPFAPGRPVSEELADILAEGLLNAVEIGATMAMICSESFWRIVISRRRAMVRDVCRRLGSAVDSGAMSSKQARKVEIGLRAVLALHDRMSRERDLAADYVDFLVRWGLDQLRWEHCLKAATPPTAAAVLDPGRTRFLGCSGAGAFFRARSRATSARRTEPSLQLV